MPSWSWIGDNDACRKLLCLRHAQHIILWNKNSTFYNIDFIQSIFSYYWQAWHTITINNLGGWNCSSNLAVFLLNCALILKIVIFKQHFTQKLSSMEALVKNKMKSSIIARLLYYIIVRHNCTKCCHCNVNNNMIVIYPWALIQVEVAQSHFTLMTWNSIKAVVTHCSFATSSKYAAINFVWNIIKKEMTQVINTI